MIADWQVPFKTQLPALLGCAFWHVPLSFVPWVLPGIWWPRRCFNVGVVFAQALQTATIMA